MKRHTQKVWKSQQSWNYESLLSHPNGKRVRIRIKRDAFDYQSYALAECFDAEANKWNEVASIPYPQMSCLKVSYIQDTATMKDFQEDEKTLLGEAEIVLS